MLTAMEVISETPIIALCTPKGSGAIALLRISGTNAAAVVDKFAKLSSKQKLANQQSHTIHHGHIVDEKTIIDEVLLFVMLSPKTFTGQDTIEISCHNNPFIIEKIIELAIKNGARQAQQGEFTRRAVLNKKIDLLQAESINELITAQTELSLKKSMAQLKGTLSSHVESIEKKLFSLLCLVESSFEFLEEEQQDIDLDKKIKSFLKALIDETREILQNFSAQKQIREGIRIALLGNVNVGKSTLFNKLIKKERAIVTNKPGTTRDAIETTIYKDGHFLCFVDTAGLRKTNNVIEKEGIKRTWQEATQSDIIFLVIDHSANQHDQEKVFYEKIKKEFGEKVIMIANKIDLAHSKISKAIPISAKNGIGIEKLQENLQEKIKNIFKTAQAPFLLNQRQHKILSELHVALVGLEKSCSEIIHYELVASQLKQLLELMTQLTGGGVNEKMLDTVFSNFCVGK
jgi:tRNA modification GTPase